MGVRNHVATKNDDRGRIEAGLAATKEPEGQPLPQPAVDELGALLTVSEAAADLRLSRSKIYELMESGHLMYCKFGKSRRIPRNGLVAFKRQAVVAR